MKPTRPAHDIDAIYRSPALFRCPACRFKKPVSEKGRSDMCRACAPLLPTMGKR